MSKNKQNQIIGACGICCSTCGLYVKGICSGCNKTREGVEFLKKINANCPVLECAVENKVDVCSRDCEKFPCNQFQNWPLSEEWIKMYKERSNQSE